MTHTAPDAQPQAIVTATTAFLDSLSADQRVQVQFTFTPQQTASAAHFTGGPNNRIAFVGEQYGQAVWSNFPVSDVSRPGLTLGSLSAEERNAAIHLCRCCSPEYMYFHLPNTYRIAYCFATIRYRAEDNATFSTAPNQDCWKVFLASNRALR
jgi:hypothetical protein